MANIYTAYKVCTTCYGSLLEKIAATQPDGSMGYSEIPCTACNQEGKVEAFTVDLTDLEDKIDDIIDKLADIKEVLDDM